MEGAEEGYYSRMRDTTNVLRLGGVNWSVGAWRIAGWGKVVHGGCGSVCGGLLKASTGDLMLQTHYLWTIAGGGVVAARDERGR